MPRYLFRVQYTLTDDSVLYEPICVDAATEDAARTDVDAATTRYPATVKATKTITLVSTA